MISLVLNKIEYIVGKVLEVIVTVTLSITVILTLMQVVYRYVLQQPITWSQEALMISFVYSVLFGAALAIKNKEHLTVDLYENIPKLFSIFLQALEFIVVGTVIVVLGYYGYMLMMDNLQSGQTLASMPVKKAYIYAAIPISSLFMLFFHIKKVFG